MANTGTLSVHVTTAGGSKPLSGALVRITGYDENSELTYSLLTDQDGITEPITLPAPLLIYSLEPNGAQPGFSSFDVEISAPNYYRKKISHVSVFPGVVTSLPVNMIPMTQFDSSANEPKGGGNVVIPENTHLG